MPRQLEPLPGFPVEEFLRHNADWSEDTRRSYRRALDDLCAFLQGRAPTPGLLSDWKQDLQRRGYRARTINMRVSAANCYFRWCGRMDLLTAHGHAGAPVSPELTRAEYLRLLRAARVRGRHQLYLLAKVFAVTGLPQQCLEQVTAQVVRAGRADFAWRGGTYAFRLPGSLQRELLDYMAEEGIAAGPLFLTRSGGVITRSTLCRQLRELCREAGVPQEKASARALRNLYQTTREALTARMEELLRQAYDDLLETEQLTAGWQEGA